MHPIAAYRSPGSGQPWCSFPTAWGGLSLPGAHGVACYWLSMRAGDSHPTGLCMNGSV